MIASLRSLEGESHPILAEFQVSLFRWTKDSTGNSGLGLESLNLVEDGVFSLEG
jgi:hypothetical protein